MYAAVEAKATEAVRLPSTPTKHNSVLPLWTRGDWDKENCTSGGGGAEDGGGEDHVIRQHRRWQRCAWLVDIVVLVGRCRDVNLYVGA